MSKKRLDRSILEGGRAGYNKFERHYSTKEERTSVRNETSKVRDEEDALDLPPMPKRKPVSKQFTDKLGGVQRWLKKQVGRKWDEVFSEIKQRFDTRNLAGKHVVYDHLLRDVRGSGLQESMFFGYDYRRFYVDGSGVLRETGPSTWQKAQTERRKANASKKDFPSQRSLNAWLGARMVIIAGSKLFWAEPVRVITEPCSNPGYCQYEHFMAITKNKVYEHFHRRGQGFRQGVEIKGRDKKFWNSLADYQKDSIEWKK